MKTTTVTLSRTAIVRLRFWVVDLNGCHRFRTADLGRRSSGRILDPLTTLTTGLLPDFGGPYVRPRDAVFIDSHDVDELTIPEWRHFTSVNLGHETTDAKKAQLRDFLGTALNIVPYFGSTVVGNPARVIRIVQGISKQTVNLDALKRLLVRICSLKLVAMSRDIPVDDHAALQQCIVENVRSIGMLLYQRDVMSATAARDLLTARARIGITATYHWVGTTSGLPNEMQGFLRVEEVADSLAQSVARNFVV